VSSLRSGLDEYASEDLRILSDEVLADSLVELERASGAIEAERARRVAEAAGRVIHTRDGHLSVTAWLARLLRTPASVAARYHRWGTALERMPQTREALTAGEISSSAASLLVQTAERHPEPFERDEAVLVEAARTLDARDLSRALAYWRQLADAEAAPSDEALRRERRRLHASPTLDGMVRVDGDLDAEDGQVVITALRAEMDASARDDGADERTPPQRRADALVEICRRYLDSGDRPTVAGERPHIVVTLDLESLEGRAGRCCELDDAGVISPGAARCIACDASVSRGIITGRSEPAGRRPTHSGGPARDPSGSDPSRRRL
jgi:hypothetical protein